MSRENPGKVIIAELLEQFEYHRKEAERYAEQAKHHAKKAENYRQAATLIKGDDNDKGNVIPEQLRLSENFLAELSIRHRISQDKTFESKISSILMAERKILRMVDLIEKYNSTEQKRLGVDTFSAMVSNLIKRKGTIKKYELKDNVVSDRFWYGLSSWWDKNELRDQYKN